MEKGIKERYVMNPKECAEYIGLGENLVRALCTLKKIPAFRVGAHWKITRKAAEEFAEQLSMSEEELDANELIRKAIIENKKQKEYKMLEIEQWM